MLAGPVDSDEFRKIKEKAKRDMQQRMGGLPSPSLDIRNVVGPRRRADEVLTVGETGVENGVEALGFVDVAVYRVGTVCAVSVNVNVR